MFFIFWEIFISFRTILPNSLCVFDVEGKIVKQAQTKVIVNKHVSTREYEINGDKNKTLSIKEYVDETKPSLEDIINNLKKSYIWKTQLTIAINFACFKDPGEERVKRSQGDNIEIMIYDEADEVIQELFESLHSR